MIKTEPFDVYKMYLGIKLHFKDGDYNYIKNEGRVRANIDSFEKRSDKYFFQKLARKYNREELSGYFISNFAHGTDSKVIYDQEMAESVYNIWRSKKESMFYEVMKDVSFLVDSDISFNHYFIVSNGEHPKILTMYLRNEIMLETIIILSEIGDFLEDWRNYITEEDIWPNVYKRMVRYSEFMTIDIQKYKNKIQEIL